MSQTIGLWAAQIAVAAFLGILFLQSGLDKVLDWQGNKSYIGGYLEKTPLRRFSTFALLTITIIEVSAGIFSAAGALTVFARREPYVAFIGAVLASGSIISLFMGMRLAKDYAAAAGIVPYFLLTVVAMVLLGAN